MNMLKCCMVAIAIGSISFSNVIAKEKPNIVMFYIDDWSWNGSPVPMDASMENSSMPVLQMPNVEMLAKQGMKFSHSYGSHQCSPARASVQTGQSNPRNGYTLVLGKQKEEDVYYDTRNFYGFMPMIPNVAARRLAPDAFTIPQALKPFGYACAHVGKWHLYCDPGEYGYVVHDGDTDNDEGNTMTWGLPKGDRGPRRLPDDLKDPKLMFSITDKAIGFIEDQVKKGTPFYCQISYYAMHSGSECLPKTRDKYVENPLVQAFYEREGTTAEKIKRKDDPAVWLGMGEDLDGRIGAVLGKLKELGIEDNTYVILVSDNGYRHKELQLTPGMTQPLHSHKWWVWQGGIRVPMIVKGPGIQSGSVFHGNVSNIDFLPTFLEWAGGDPSTLNNIDGVSLAGYMAGKKPDQNFLNRYLYYHVPHYRMVVPHSAIISGNNKVMHFYEKPDLPMLFDLASDPGEVSNIATQNPEMHKQLFEEMMRYFTMVDVKYPKANNPNFDPVAYEKDRKTKERIMWGPFEGKRKLENDEL